MNYEDKIIPDTSVLIDGKLSEMIENNEINKVEIIIPEAVLDELQSQASKGREIGFEGIEEIKKLRKLKEEYDIDISHVGKRPSMEEIKLASSGRIDAIIKDHAKELDATLYTEDYVQAQVAEAEGIDVVYIETEESDDLLIKEYFDEKTMSVHLKEGCKPKAKRGSPGKFKLETISDEELKREDLEKYAKNIMDLARIDNESNVEISKKGAEVVQYKDYRIVISKPPFSLAHEITAVRPVVKLSIEDYPISDKLVKRLEERAEGIMVAGAPGSGKTTFAQSLAEFYAAQGNVVKTLESPRDLNVSKEITQLTSLNGRMDNAADVLLLVRPDYTIYDEIRKGYDFNVFADLRLTGVGMVGVVHAKNPIDAVQRFVGRTELGMIPHVLDTIIHLEAGRIAKVYSLKMRVKVPSGMTEKDLARPVVEVCDFETGKPEYEIYTYGEENIVLPVDDQEEAKAVQRLAEGQIIKELRKYDRDPEVEFVSDERVLVKVENENIPRLIGKNGSNIDEVEKRLGVSIDVEPKTKDMGKKIDFDIGETGANIVFHFHEGHSGDNANIYIDSEYLFTATVGKGGEIRLKKNSDIGNQLVQALAKKKNVEVFV